jgi:hypothetical protein
MTSTDMNSRRLFDCFTFNDELDLLEVRLRCTAPFVDFFVLVESPRTFSGSDKPLHFAANAGRYSTWAHQIRHIVVEDIPEPVPTRWVSEVHQRNQIVRGLHDASGQDVIVIADVDEIVHPEVVRTLRSTVSGLTGLEMLDTFFRANWVLPRSGRQPARAVPFAQLTDPHSQRNHVQPERIIRNAGIHFAYLVDSHALPAKFASYGHAEMDNPRDGSLVHIRRAQQLGVDLWSKALVDVVPAPSLCASQRELLSLRPDLFDFREFDSAYSRRIFRWYSTWRSMQPTASARVDELDRLYDTRRLTVSARGLQAMLVHVLYIYPHQKLHHAKRALSTFLRRYGTGTRPGQSRV